MYNKCYFNIIIFAIAIITITFSFYRKSKKDDNSISFKIIKFIKKEYPLIITFIIIVFLFNHIYFISKYSRITLKIICENILGQWNSILVNLNKIIKKFIEVFFNIEVFKIIIIGYFAMKILLNDDIFARFNTFISQIKEITISNVSLKTKEAKDEQKNNDKAIEDIQEKVKTGKMKDEEAKAKIYNFEKKKHIIALMIDNNEVVKYLYKFIQYKVNSITIPLNLVPRKIELITIDELFVYELRPNSVKLLEIKTDIYDLVKQVFDELLEKGIIYYNKN